MRSLLASLPVIVLLALAPAASAGALTVQPGGTAVLRGTDGPDDLSVAFDAATASVRLRDDTSPLTFDGTGPCVLSDLHEAVCDTRSLTGVTVFAGQGMNTLVSTGSAPPPPFLVWLAGGFDPDVIVGGPSAERIEGSDGGDTLDGGGGDDLLDGGDGADVLRGGDGDDRIVATEIWGSLVDPDVSCGPGSDRFIGDLGFDARPADCELQLAQFTGPAELVGSARTGSTLTVVAPIVGTPAPTVGVTWLSCPDSDTDGCTTVGSGPSYAVRGADVGRWLYARLIARNDTNPFHELSDWNATEHSSRVTGDPAYVPPAPAPAAPVRMPPRPTSRSTSRLPATPPPPAPSPAALAAGVLGGPAVPAPGPRSSAFGLYVPAGRANAVRIGRRPARVLAVVARRSGQARVEQVLELTPRRGKKRRVRLALRNMAMSPTTAVRVDVGLSAAQRALVRRARSARVVVKVGTGSPAVATFRVRLAG